MKNWIKGIGILGLLLGGCGATEASNKIEPMFNLEVETCGIRHDGKEDCYTFFEPLWGEVTEADLDLRLERLGTITRDTRPHVRPLPAKYLLVLNTNGCVTDNPSPTEPHDIVLSERYFASNPEEAKVRWEVTRLEAVELPAMQERLVKTAQQKAILTLQHGEGLSTTTRRCNLWERRESALHSVGYNQNIEFQD